MKYEFDKYEYTAMSVSGGKFVVKTQYGRGRRAHLYYEKRPGSLVHIGWFKNDESAAAFLDAMSEE